jgi:hypothetical protein
MMPDGSTRLRIGFHGPGVTAEIVQETVERVIALLQEVEHSQFGTKNLRLTLAALRYICDGCDRERPSAELPPDWIYVDGDDLCFPCQCQRLGIPAVFDA